MLPATDKNTQRLLHLALMIVLLAMFGLLIDGRDNLLQRWLYDLAQRHTTEPSGDRIADQLVIIGIDEDSKARLGTWPWPAALHAALIERLHASGVHAIGFTTPLISANDDATVNRIRATLGNNAAEIDAGQIMRLREALENRNGEQQLADAIHAQGHVILPAETSTKTNDGNATAPLEPLLASITAQLGTKASGAVQARIVGLGEPKLLRASAGIAHLYQPVDDDGRTRREQPLLRIGDQVIPSLSLALATQGNALDLSDSKLKTGTARPVRLGKDLSVRLNTFSDGVRLGASGFSYWQVLTGNVSAGALKDKTVIIGFTDGANADRVDTPVGPQPRVTVVAAATLGLMSGNVYQHSWVAVLLNCVLALLAIAVAALLFPQLALSTNVLIACGLGSGLLLLDFLMMRSTGQALQTIATSAALLGTAVLTTPLRLLGNNPARTKRTGIPANRNMETLKTLALTLHGQGQLDLAFETLRRCPGNSETLDLLYRLGNDFERRQQAQKAAQVFRYIAEQDANFKDAAARSGRYQEHALPVKPAFRAADIAKAAPPPKPAVAVPATPARPGKEMLGRYEIERQIGKGAMGVVYLGRDPKINRIVAIKAIPLAQEFDDTDLAEARERFFREAEMAGRLNHPGIVTIYDAGEDRGLAYIAMEYLHGEHLSYYCDPKRLLPPRKALGIIQRVADALGYAHRQNVVHRDIKPANIMLNIDNDVMKITDFGIARLADVSRTKTGIVLGTPSFMSPEQLEGRPLDGRSDLFALGVTMYQLLTGQLPFRADSMTRLMNNIALEPHPPIRSLRPELPASVETIVDRALAKDAADRYQTGSEMAEAIRDCLRTIKP